MKLKPKFKWTETPFSRARFALWKWLADKNCVCLESELDEVEDLAYDIALSRVREAQQQHSENLKKNLTPKRRRRKIPTQ